LLTLGWPIPVVIALAILAAAAWGFLNALIVVYGKLNPIIVTLATNFIGGAIMFLIYQTIQAPLKSPLTDYGHSYFLGLPSIWWPMVLLILLVGFLLPRTRYGRHTIAVGGSRYAAQARGISLKKTRFAVFTISGAIVGIAGVLFAASGGPFSPNDGATFQFAGHRRRDTRGRIACRRARQHLADPSECRLPVDRSHGLGVLRLLVELAGDFPGCHLDQRRR